MKKLIITLIAFLFFSLSAYCQQYIILPQQGNAIEAQKIFKNDNIIKYIKINGDDGTIAIDKIIQIMDLNGNDVNIDNLPSEKGNNEVENKRKTVEEISKEQQRLAEQREMENQEQQRLSNLQQQQTQQQKAHISETTKSETNKYDLIVTKDAQSIKAVVQKINDTEVEYKKFDNQSGPIYTIKRYDVQSIVYSNGEVEVFVGEKKRESVAEDICIFKTNCGYEVMCQDLPRQMTWVEAQTGCPSGFHLPSFDELECICKEHSPRYDDNNKKVQGALIGKEYWTSSTDRKNRPLTITTNDCESETNDSSSKFSVRCIKK
ncbi:MAG: hypothetical protein LBV69_09585 [Bacteroidales bacterium]|jgi:hypothetical protein|nr:hypothetical protein [Bacteroidales bacterium]